ncbi:MAG: hypothetical protein Q7R75_01320 [bacterium]|nr:hypothetical protein [bacterium]
MTPNDLGKRFLVEECKKVKMSEFIGNYRRKTKELMLASEIEVSDIKVALITSKTGFGGIRYWFKCPLCPNRVSVIFQHPLTEEIGCRRCLNLEYRKRRYKGMIEGKLP